MKTNPLKSLPLIAALAALTSCDTVNVSSWTDPAFIGRPVGKTMILGVAESDALSRQYEGLFVERLAELGIDATSLHAALQTTVKVPEDALVAALRENAFSSIIVTRLLSETERQQVITTGYPAHYGSYYGFYAHAYGMSRTSAEIQSFMEYELETNLYDVDTRKLVWTGRKVIYDDRSDMTNMKGIVKGVIKDLRAQGMID